MTAMQDKLLTFPCLFPIKIMGINNEALVAEVVAIIAAHTTHFDPDNDISTKPSSKGNYIAITANIMATSQEQLDTIYRELNNHKLVRVTL